MIHEPTLEQMEAKRQYRYIDRLLVHYPVVSIRPDATSDMLKELIRRCRGVEDMLHDTPQRAIAMDRERALNIGGRTEAYLLCDTCDFRFRCYTCR